MLILAFETSAKAASAALLEDGKLLGESYQNTGLTHSQTLMVMAENLLHQCGKTVNDVNAVAVAAGPACNLLLWALLSSVGGEALAPFAGAHLILGALNLLPVRPMDGGRLLWLLVSLCSEPYTADRVAYITGAAVSSALLLVCLYLTLTTGGGLFLLPGVLWLTVNGVLPNGTKHDKISCYNK